jgi:hypothetical protein
MINWIEKNKWIEQIFQAKISNNGGIVRRSVMSVKRYASMEDLEHAVKRRGFHMIVAGGQCIICCNDGDVRLNC